MKFSSSPGTATFSRSLGVQDGVERGAGSWQRQEVFFKRLHSGEPGQRARFLHEGHILSRLDHPLIVPLIGRSRQQLVFPLLPGCTLRERLERGPLDAETALRLVLRLLDPLEYLHAQGVTHHDLKPENVMLLSSRLEVPCLIDFGMAHDRYADGDLYEGTRMGTPQFMAPEQFQGVRGDPRSDYFSLGALLWESVTGTLPHPDPLGWLLGLNAERLSWSGPESLHPLLEALLCRDLSGRPQTATAARTLIRRALAGLRGQLAS